MKFIKISMKFFSNPKQNEHFLSFFLLRFSQTSNDLCCIAASTRQLLPNDKWNHNATTVAGGHSRGNEINQLSFPCGVNVDDGETIYVADQFNHRVVEWKCGATSGKVVAGGNGRGNRNDQLNSPL